MRVASLLVHEHWARRTTVGVALDNFTVTEVHTRTTRFGASTVARPARYLAVDGATEGVAGVSGRKRRTDDASMGNVGHDGTSLGLGANPTGLGA
jgi:hypothetical protein